MAVSVRSLPRSGPGPAGLVRGAASGFTGVTEIGDFCLTPSLQSPPVSYDSGNRDKGILKVKKVVVIPLSGRMPFYFLFPEVPRGSHCPVFQGITQFSALRSWRCGLVCTSNGNDLIFRIKSYTLPSKIIHKRCYWRQLVRLLS